MVDSGLLSNEGIIPETGLGLDGVGTVLGPGIKGMLTGDFNAFSGIGTVLGYGVGGPIGAAIGGAIGKSIGGGKDVDRNIHFGGLQIPDEAPEFIQRFKLGGGAHDLSDYRGFDHVFNNLANPVRAVSDIMVKRLQTLGLDELGQEVTDARANLDAVASSPQHASFKIQQLLDVVTGAEVVVQNAFDYIDNNPEKKSLFENSSGVSFDNFKKELDRQGFEYFHGQIIDPLYTLAKKNIESDVSNYQNQTISPDEIRKAIDSGAPIGGELERAIGTHTKQVAQKVMGGKIVFHEGLYYQADGAGFPIAGTGVSAGDLARMRAGGGFTAEEKVLNPITPEIISQLQEENTKKVTEGHYGSVGEISRQGDPRERTKEFNTYFNGDFRNPIIDISGARNAFIGADNTGSAPVKEPTPQPQQGQGLGIKSEVLGQKSLQPGLLSDAFIPGEATAPSTDIYVDDPRYSNDLRYDPGMPDVQELTPQPDTTTPDLGTTDISPFTGDTSTTSTFSEEARKAVEGWERELEAYESSLTPDRVAEIRGEIDRGGITTDPNKKGFGIPTSTLLGIAALGTGLLTGGGSGSDTTDTELDTKLDIELPPSTQFPSLSVPFGGSNTNPYKSSPYTEEVSQGNIKPPGERMMPELKLPKSYGAYPFTNRPDTTPIFGLL